MKNSHLFDFDTIISINSSVWLVDKSSPSIPILKISQSDFNLIKNGIYKSQGNSLNFGGHTYWVPTEMMEKIKIKCKNYKADISNLAFSMQEFMNKELIENLEYTINIDNIIHLKNSNDDIYVICAKNSRKNYELMITKVESMLKEIGITIKKFYYLSETFYNRNSDDITHKKVRLLLQHIVGFKTGGDKFTDTELEKYDNVYYYDDEENSIQFAINSNKLLTFLLKNTEDSISKIIKDDLKSRKCFLIVNYVTNNKVNKFKTAKVNIKVDNIIKSFENFKYKP